MNNVSIIGRLTADPELKYTNSGTPVVGFSIAWNDKDKNAHYFNCTAWSKTAELVAEYFKKGKEIAIQGRLDFSKWEDKEGQKRTNIKIICEKISFTGKKEDS